MKSSKTNTAYLSTIFYILCSLFNVGFYSSLAVPGIGRAIQTMRSAFRRRRSVQSEVLMPGSDLQARPSPWLPLQRSSKIIFGSLNRTWDCVNCTLREVRASASSIILHLPWLCHHMSARHSSYHIRSSSSIISRQPYIWSGCPGCCKLGRSL